MNIKSIYQKLLKLLSFFIFALFITNISHASPNDCIQMASDGQYACEKAVDKWTGPAGETVAETIAASWVLNST